jgi:hypothetical protein
MGTERQRRLRLSDSAGNHHIELGSHLAHGRASPRVPVDARVNRRSNPGVFGYNEASVGTGETRPGTVGNPTPVYNDAGVVSARL